MPQRWQKGLPVSQPDECLQLAHLLCILGRQLPGNETKRNTGLRFVAASPQQSPLATTSRYGLARGGRALQWRQRLVSCSPWPIRAW